MFLNAKKIEEEYQIAKGDINLINDITLNSNITLKIQLINLWDIEIDVKIKNTNEENIQKIEGLYDEINVYLLAEIINGEEKKLKKPVELTYFYLTTQNGKYLDYKKNGLINLNVPLMINTELDTIIMAYNEWKEKQKNNIKEENNPSIL